MSGLPFPSPGDLPDPGIKARFPAFQVGSLLSEPPGKPIISRKVPFIHMALNVLCHQCLLIREGCPFLENRKWRVGPVGILSSGLCKASPVFPLRPLLYVYCRPAIFWFLHSFLKWVNIFNQMEKAMATHSSTLAWKIPWTEEPGRLQSMGSLRVRHDWVASLSLFTFIHWRRKWQPLQCSCLENPRDRGAWWATVSGVAQSRTRLKWLSSSSSFNQIS